MRIEQDPHHHGAQPDPKRPPILLPARARRSDQPPQCPRRLAHVRSRAVHQVVQLARRTRHRSVYTLSIVSGVSFIAGLFAITSTRWVSASNIFSVLASVG